MALPVVLDALTVLQARPELYWQTQCLRSLRLELTIARQFQAIGQARDTVRSLGAGSLQVARQSKLFPTTQLMHLDGEWQIRRHHAQQPFNAITHTHRSIDMQRLR